MRTERPSPRLFTVAAFSAFAALATSSFIIGCSSTPERQSTGELVDDSAITAKVKAALAEDPMVSAMQVRVQTYKGVVQLSGFVNDVDAKKRAEQLASSVAGVQEVNNDIVVKEGSVG